MKEEISPIRLHIRRVIMTYVSDSGKNESRSNINALPLASMSKSVNCTFDKL